MKYLDYDYSLQSDGTAAITNYLGQEPHISIPDRINGVAVTSISTGAFQRNKSLVAVTIPDSVTLLGASAFDGCQQLLSVSIGAGVRYVGHSVFRDCPNLTNLLIDDKHPFLAVIRGVLYNMPRHLVVCGLKAVVSGELGFLPDTQEIAPHAFEDCEDVTSVSIPASVRKIGYEAFSRCRQLSRLTFAGGVTHIGDLAFNGCAGLTSVRLPDSLRSLGNYAFANCTQLTDVSLGRELSDVGANPFAYCRSLGRITCAGGNRRFSLTEGNLIDLADSRLILHLNDHAALPRRQAQTPTHIRIPAGVRRIGDGAFIGLDYIRGVDIPAGVTSIGCNAFGRCEALTGVSLPDSLAEIGQDAFYTCRSLRSVAFGNGPVSMLTNPFKYCKQLRTFTVSPNHPTLMEKNGLLIDRKEQKVVCCPADPASTSVVIPSGIRIIGAEAFQGCANLTSVTVPASVTAIGRAAFGHSAPAFPLIVQKDSFAHKWCISNRYQHMVSGN